MAQLNDNALISDANLQGYWRLESPIELNSTSLLNDANLQGYWRLEADGTDSGPNGYTLTGTAPTFATGKFGNGGDFETSSSQYISNAGANCRIAGSQTFSAWVKPESAPSVQGRILAVSDSTPTNYVSLTTTASSTFSFQVSGLTAVEVTTDGTFATGSWYHVVGRYDSDANTLAIWINGVKKSISVTGTHTAGSGSVAIGRLGDYSATDTYFDGIIDDCAIFNRALTDDEIGELFLLGKDSSANNYHIGAVASPVNATGKFGDGVDLEEGSSQYLTLPDSSCANLEITGSKSWGAWIKPEATGAGSYRYIMSKFHNVNQTGSRMGVDSNSHARFQCKGLTTNEAVDGTTTLLTGVWYFIVGVYDSAATKLRIYVNAVKETEVTASGSSTDSNTAFDIGSNSGDQHVEPFDGLIDDVFVFNRALTDTEITSLFTGISQSASMSPSGSLSPSASESKSLSPSSSASSSASASSSRSASSSSSASLSPSGSLSPSSSESSSRSLSGSPSASASPSLSPSASGSASGSASSSASGSASPSDSGSRSASASLSPSSSLSPSASVSASPSPARYTSNYADVGNTYTDKYTSTL